LQQQLFIPPLPYHDPLNSVLRVVDYFSTVDKNGDNKVEFDEALKHCFPHVPHQHLENLKKWLRPQNYDIRLFQELQNCALEGPKDTWRNAFGHLTHRCRQLVHASNDKARQAEHDYLGRGYVSEAVLASILKRCHSTCHLSASMEKPQIVATHESSNPNFFTTTIFVISSAIQKLARIDSTCAKKEHRKQFFRGYSDVEFDDSVTGYCELGFLSSSFKESVAYSVASQYRQCPEKKILILEIDAPIGGAADVEDYSQ
jgi:hypothetical protein